MFNTPILLLAFNRPDTIAKLVDSLKVIKPFNLFVVVDGPRPEREDDKINVLRVQEIINQISWDCNIRKLYRKENLGCGAGPANAITWFFNNVEQGIILEDDCIPDESFFSYCEILLDRYKNNERVMHIAGNNPLFKTNNGNGTYYFSKYPLIWGWATWRRAWVNYDFNISELKNENFRQRIESLVKNTAEREYLLTYYDEVYGGKRKDIWDFQWNFTLVNNHGIAITPNVNLVSNIGFGENATHTLNPSVKEAFLSTGKLDKITHPDRIDVCHKADSRLYAKIWAPKTSILNRCRNILYKILPKRFLLFYWDIKKKIK